MPPPRAIQTRICGSLIAGIANPMTNYTTFTRVPDARRCTSTPNRRAQARVPQKLATLRVNYVKRPRPQHRAVHRLHHRVARFEAGLQEYPDSLLQAVMDKCKEEVARRRQSACAPPVPPDFMPNIAFKAARAPVADNSDDPPDSEMIL